MSPSDGDTGRFYGARMFGSSAAGELRLMDRMDCSYMNILNRDFIIYDPVLGF